MLAVDASHIVTDVGFYGASLFRRQILTEASHEPGHIEGIIAMPKYEEREHTLDSRRCLAKEIFVWWLWLSHLKVREGKQKDHGSHPFQSDSMAIRICTTDSRQVVGVNEVFSHPWIGEVSRFSLSTMSFEDVDRLYGISADFSNIQRAFFWSP